MDAQSEVATPPERLSSLRASLAIIAVSVFVMAPALFVARMLSGDAHLHIRWQGAFAPIFWHETPYPRWITTLNHGFGSPAFFIYPPGEQWLAALLHPLLPGPELAGTRIIVMLLACLIVSGLGMWRWLVALPVGRAAALAGAIVYVLLPYHAYLNCYQRGAIAEQVGMAMLPWGMAFARELAGGRRLAWAGFALAVAAQFYSHAPTALFGVPFVCVYALVQAPRVAWLAHAIRVGAAAALGTALAAAYLGPAFTQTALIHPEFLFQRDARAENYLLFSAAEWPDYGIRVVVTLLAALHTGLALLLGAALWRAPRLRSLARGLTIVTLLVTVAMTEPARAFWTAGTGFEKIQFAWRMMSLQTLALAALAAIAWDAAAGWHGRSAPLARRLLPLAVAGLFVIDAGLFATRILHSVSGVPSDHDIVADRSEVEEYQLGALPALRRRFGAARVLAVAGGPAAVSVRDWRSRFVTLDVAAAQDGVIALRQFAYSGWRMRVDDGAWRPAGRVREPFNIVAVPVPAGRHRIALELTPTAWEQAGDRITLAAIALLLIGVLRHGKRRLGPAGTVAMGRR